MARSSSPDTTAWITEPEADAYAWNVGTKGFAWERPLRKADREALGAAAPDGPILAAMVPDLGAKEALLADDPDVYFTTPHFKGHRSVLLRASQIHQLTRDEVAELVQDAWLSRASKTRAKAWLASLDGTDPRFIKPA